MMNLMDVMLVMGTAKNVKSHEVRQDKVTDDRQNGSSLFMNSLQPPATRKKPNCRVCNVPMKGHKCPQR